MVSRLDKSLPVVVSMVGARPQFVKLAPLAMRLAQKRYSNRVRHVIIHSGQHYDPLLSDIFFSELGIPSPDLNLEVGSGTHGAMTADILRAFDAALLRERPAVVIVYGDTNTTLAGALAAVKMGIKVAHVEAGLRSFDWRMPEEINRTLADHASDLLLCPTTTAVKNARRENVHGDIKLVGDVMYELLERIRPQLLRETTILKKYNSAPGEYVLATAHRAENVDTRANLEAILEMLAKIPCPVVFPTHPRTRQSIEKYSLGKKLASMRHVHIVSPLSYLENLTMAAHAKFVLTDSGGLQKEAVFLGVPCLTMRDRTEWPETLRHGNALVGLSVKKLQATLRNLPRAKPMQWKQKGVMPTSLIADSILQLARS